MSLNQQNKVLTDMATEIFLTKVQKKRIVKRKKSISLKIIELFDRYGNCRIFQRRNFS